jgi:ribonuclease HII
LEKQPKSKSKSAKVWIMQQPRLSRAKNRRFLEITTLERAARAQGFSKIAGVDEAGRGPLAGPVVAAACILPEDFFIPKIDDSKRLSPRQREEMFVALTEHPCVHYGIGFVQALVIDQINILQAALRAMALAIDNLKEKPDFILVDGRQKPSTKIPCQATIRGDSLSQSIMAAAILAKVFRDHWMSELDEQFPHYGFASHKGYPTPEHLAALDKWGPCPIHRQSYAPVKRAAR